MLFFWLGKGGLYRKLGVLCVCYMEIVCGECILELYFLDCVRDVDDIYLNIEG